MTEEIIFNASVNTGDTVNDLNAVNSALGEMSTGASQASDELAEMKKRANDLRNQLIETARGSEEFKKIQAELVNLTGAIRETEKESINLNARFDEVYGDIQPLSGRMGELEDRLYELALAGKKNTDEFRAIQAEVVRFREVIVATDAEVDNLASRGADMQAAFQLGETVVAGYGAFQGVLALTGNQSEALEETMVKLNAIQLVLTSTEQIRASLEAESFLMIKARIVVTNLLSGAYQRQIVSLFSLSGVTTLWTTITAGASTAMGVLNAIMLANPALLIVAGIAALVGALAFFSSSSETAEEDNERLNDSLERSNELLDVANEKMIRTANNRLKLAQAEGASEEELLKKKLDVLKAEETARLNEINKAKQDIRAKVKIFNQAYQELNEDLVLSTKEEILTLDKKYKKLKQLDGQYYQDKRVLVTEFATKERKEAEKQTEEDAQKAEQVRKDQAQKAKENAEKRLAKQKEEEQRKIELAKTITDLSITNIQDEQDRKFALMAVAHQRERDELIKKYGKDTELELQLKEKQTNEFLAFEEEERKAKELKEKESLEKKHQLQNASDVAMLEGKLIQLENQSNVENELNKENFKQKLIDDQAKFDAEQELKRELAEVQRDIALENEELTEGEKFKILQEFDAKIATLDKEKVDREKANDEAMLMARKELATGLTTILGNLTQLAKKNSATQKALAIADIAFQTATGFMDGLRLAQKAAIETPTPVGKALVFGSFITSQFLAVKNAVNKAKEAIGGGVTSVSPPSTSGGGSSFGGAENGNDGTGLGTNTTTNTNTLNNGINTPILVVDSLSKVINQNTQAIEVATRG